MRREAAAISASDPTHRLPVPTTDDTLARLAVTLNLTFDRLQEALERERRFVDDASHELRTPLTILKAEVDSALAGGPQPRRSPRRPRGRVRRGEPPRPRRRGSARPRACRARADPDASLARVARGPGRGEPPRVRRDGRGCRRRPGGRGTGRDRGARRHPGQAGARQPDRERAPAHAPGRRSSRVTAAVGGETVTIEVDDTGTGFDPAELDAVFQPFNRGRDAVHEGSGLGLAIVRAIAEAHGGTVAAANRPEGGARVTLTLEARHALRPVALCDDRPAFAMGGRDGRAGRQ